MLRRNPSEIKMSVFFFNYESMITHLRRLGNCRAKLYIVPLSITVIFL